MGIRLFLTLSACLYSAAFVAGNEPVRQNVFEKTVRPFLTQHCEKCHGSKVPKGELNLSVLNPDMKSGPDAAKWNQIRYRLVADEMPPDDQPQPPHGPEQQIIQWLTRELQAANIKLLEPEGYFLPKNGNKVNHELLFNGTIKGPSATKGRLWRLGPDAYESLIKGELAKNVKGLAQPFGKLSDAGFKDYAAAFSIDEPTTDQLIRNAQAIVASQTRGELKDGKWSAKGYPQPVKEFVALFEPKNQPLSEDLKLKAINRQFQLILKRQPSEQEQTRFLSFLERNIESTSLELGVKTTMEAVLLTPEAVFRLELGAGEPDQYGRRLLAPRELAYAISFALTDRRPDDQILRAAAEGRLTTEDDVKREVDRIFDTEKILKPRIMRFFREYFGYAQATEIFKDKEANPHHRADVLVRDTDQLIEWILQKDKDVLYELLTTNKSFINYKYDAKRKTHHVAQSKNLIHTSYGLPVDWKWTPHQPVELPKEERAGILTHPSWLVANSGNFDNHPILRGKWIRERLLGGTIPDLPITVDAQLPEEPENTLRHRMRVTREDYCWNCHQRMNPLGLTFESYDHFGRFRTVELVVDLKATAEHLDKKGKPLGNIFRRIPADSSGEIALIDEPQLTNKYDNAVQMIHQLAKSDYVRQVFVRHVFRYFLGRNEELSDSPTLIAADSAYQKSGGSFRAMVTSILTSDSFLYRINEVTDDEPVEKSKND